MKDWNVLASVINCFQAVSLTIEYQRITIPYKGIAIRHFKWNVWNFIGFPWYPSVNSSQDTTRFQWKSTVLCISKWNTRILREMCTFYAFHFDIRAFHSKSTFELQPHHQERSLDRKTNKPWSTVIRYCLWHRDSVFDLVVLSRLLYRQDKRMDELNLFIDYHYKSIVSIIWARHVLTLHLSHANWGKLKHSLYWPLQERSCTLCNFYQIESYQTFSSCNPLSM